MMGPFLFDGKHGRVMGRNRGRLWREKRRVPPFIDQIGRRPSTSLRYAGKMRPRGNQTSQLKHRLSAGLRQLRPRLIGHRCRSGELGDVEARKIDLDKFYLVDEVMRPKRLEIASR